MAIQRNVKISFAIASAMLVVSLVGLIATQKVEIEHSTPEKTQPKAPRIYSN